MVMLSGKYGLIFRWIRKVYPTIIKWKTKRLDFHGNNIFFFGISLGIHLGLLQEIIYSGWRLVSRGCPVQMLLRKRVSFFPLPLRPILDKRSRSVFFISFLFFNHISFLLSQARFSQLNAAWLIRPFLHSSCPTKRSFQPFSLSLSALFTSTTFTATHDQNVREKKKIKKITRQRPVHLDDIQKKK